uniref:Uncharacterized protein n=1 Tax=Arundo donax TaxID=35708 RepID=A0A0A8XPK9_ARUDO
MMLGVELAGVQIDKETMLGVQLRALMLLRPPCAAALRAAAAPPAAAPPLAAATGPCAAAPPAWIWQPTLRSRCHGLEISLRDATRDEGSQVRCG